MICSRYNKHAVYQEYLVKIKVLVDGKPLEVQVLNDLKVIVCADESGEGLVVSDNYGTIPIDLHVKFTHEGVITELVSTDPQDQEKGLEIVAEVEETYMEVAESLV